MTVGEKISERDIVACCAGTKAEAVVAIAKKVQTVNFMVQAFLLTNFSKNEETIVRRYLRDIVVDSNNNPNHEHA
jgi:hypothetical protein